MDKKKSIWTIISETRIIHILLSILLGFVVGAFFLVVMGLDVGAAYGRLISSVTSVKGFSYVVVYGIPYIMTGLSVAFSFRTGIFNIGAEGQFVVLYAFIRQICPRNSVNQSPVYPVIHGLFFKFSSNRSSSLIIFISSTILSF